MGNERCFPPEKTKPTISHKWVRGGDFSEKNPLQQYTFQPSYINLEQILTILKQSVRFQKNQLIILRKLKTNYRLLKTRVDDTFSAIFQTAKNTTSLSKRRPSTTYETPETTPKSMLLSHGVLKESHKMDSYGIPFEKSS